MSLCTIKPCAGCITTFLTTTLDTGERYVSHPGHFTPGEWVPDTLWTGVGWNWEPVWTSWRRETSPASVGNRTNRSSSPEPSHYIEYVIQTSPSRPSSPIIVSRRFSLFNMWIRVYFPFTRMHGHSVIRYLIGFDVLLRRVPTTETYKVDDRRKNREDWWTDTD
jgi:hypothetical protein